jgi:hypothetical protein
VVVTGVFTRRKPKPELPAAPHGGESA